MIKRILQTKRKTLVLVTGLCYNQKEHIVQEKIIDLNEKLNSNSI